MEEWKRVTRRRKEKSRHVTEMDEQKKVSAFVIVKCRIYEENVMSDDIW